MKTKIIRHEGVQSLVVDDEKVNATSQFGGPIVLAKIANYADSGCWSYEDYRLREYLIPSPFLSDSHVQIYNFKDYPEEDKQLIFSKIKDYIILENEGLMYWRYDTHDINGDIPKDDPRRKFTDGTPYPPIATFTFKEAQKRLREAKEFWTNYEGSLTDESIRLPNPNRQPSNADYFMDLSFNKEKYDSPKKNKM